MPPCRAHSPMAKMSWIGGFQPIVDHDAAALADGEADLPGEIVARPNAGRDDDHVDVERGAVGELDPLDAAVAVNRLRRLVEMDVHAERFDLAGPESASRRRRPAAASAAGRTRRRAFPAPDRNAALAASSPSSPPPITAQRFDVPA